MGFPILNLRGLRSPIFRLRAFKNFWAFVYERIFIMITCYLVENLVCFAVIVNVLTHLGFQPKDEKTHLNDKT